MRRKETRVERVGSDDQMTGDGREQPPSLRIAGYVSDQADDGPDRPPGRQADGVTLPNIADYWPDAPHRRRAQPRSGTEQPPGWQVLLPDSPRPTREIGPRRDESRTWLRKPILLAGVLALVFVGGTVALVRQSGMDDQQNAAAPAPVPTTTSTAPAPTDPASVAPPPPSIAPSTEPTPGKTTPAAPPPPPPPDPLPDRAHFVLADGVTELSVRTADLDDKPFEVSTPAGSGLEVGTTFKNGVLRVEPEKKGDGSGKLNVRLNQGIVWHVQINDGVRLGRFDLDSGPVSRIDLDGGAERFEVSLGRLARTLPLRMTGGVGAWRIETAEKVPVKVNVGSGAGDVVLYGRGSGGIGKRETVRSGDLDDAPGLDIDAAAGMGSLEVTED